jgi:hypothetical protein
MHGWYWLDPATALVIAVIVSYHAIKLTGKITAALRAPLRAPDRFAVVALGGLSLAPAGSVHRRPGAYL